MRATSCSPSRRREEEAAALLVAEELDGEPREPVRLLEPAQLAGRDVQLVEAVGDVRVVLEEAGVLRLARTVGAEEAPILGGERPEQELAERRAASIQSARSSRRPASASAASASPFHDAIALSSRAGFGRRSRSSKRRDRRSSGTSPRMIERPCSNGCRSSAGTPSASRPREGQPLDAVRVGVLRRGEAALRQAQLAQHVLEGLLDHAR